MDSAHFNAGMDLLDVLPSQASIDPKKRFRVYCQEFAGDDGALFLAACRVGFNTVWRFFPSAVEIREQMQLLRDAHDRCEARRHYEALVDQAQREVDADLQRRLVDSGLVAADVESLRRLPVRRLPRGGDPMRIGDVLDLDAIRRKRGAVSDGGGVA